MKRSPRVRVLSKEFYPFKEGTMGVTIPGFFDGEIKFSILSPGGRGEVTFLVPLDYLNDPPKPQKVAYLAQLFWWDPVLAIQATYHQEVLKSLLHVLIEQGISMNEKQSWYKELKFARAPKLGSWMINHVLNHLKEKLEVRE